jgi:hypothetical protein
MANSTPYQDIPESTRNLSPRASLDRQHIPSPPTCTYEHDPLGADDVVKRAAAQRLQQPWPAFKSYRAYDEYQAWVPSGGLAEFQKSAEYQSLSKSERYFEELQIIPGLREVIRAEREAYDAGCTFTSPEDAMRMVRELDAASDAEDETEAKDKTETKDETVSLKTHS